MDQLSKDVVEYYTVRYREDLRLTDRPQARLERTRTLELLSDLLPPEGAKVLDVGGAPASRTPTSTASRSSWTSAPPRA